MTFEDLLKQMSQPAQSALINAHIDSIEKLRELSDKDLLKLHGLGKASLPLIHQAQKKD